MAKKDKREMTDMFKALGDPTRLKIYQFLRGRCWPHVADETEEIWLDHGPTVSEVCTKVTGSKKITSKVSQHLKELRLAGLITIERRGKNMICGINQQAVHTLIALLNSVEEVESVPAQVEAVVELPVLEVELVKRRKKTTKLVQADRQDAETPIEAAPVVEVVPASKPGRKAKTGSTSPEPPAQAA